MADSTQNKDGTSIAETGEQVIVDILEFFSGDLVIRAGADDRYGLIRVHKTCMIAASPVFAKMLNGGFREATKTYTEAEPLVLNGDNYDAFLDMCKIIHYQKLEGEGGVTLQRAVAIAIVADKYRCAPQVLQAVIPNIRRIIYIPLKLHNSLWHGQARTLLCLAYLAKDKNLFSEFSKQYVVDLQLAPEADKVNDALLRISLDITGMLERSRKRQLSDLETQYYSALENETLYGDECGTRDELNQKIGQYTYEMLRLKKRNAKHLEDCMVSLSKMLEGLEKAAAKLPTTKVYCRSHARYEGGNFKQHILDTVAQTRASLRGLCLECDVVGDFGVEGGCNHFT